MTNEPSTQSLSEPFVVFWNRFRTLLASPIDAASLAVFRIIFGLVMVWEAYRYLIPKNGMNRVQSLFSQDFWHFPYHGFEWVKPWSETGMHIHFWVLGALGLCVALGLFYRVVAVGMFLAFTYIFLLDSALYLNHFYLMCLLSFLLAVMPANRCWSIDAWWKSRRRSDSSWAHASIPFWPVFLLRAQLFIVYIFAGFAKLSADWLSANALSGAHGRITEFLNTNFSFLGTFAVHDVGLMMSWSGMAFDLSIGFLLICRRTRLLGILMMGMFHLVNHFTFPIGVFPLMAFTASLIFLDPDWPRCVWAWIRRPRFARPNLKWLVGGALAVPVVGAALGWKRQSKAYVPSGGIHRLSKVVAAFIVVWVVIQCAIPLRHFWTEGNPEWTEEHHRFSWRMMLKSKSAVDIKFDIGDEKIVPMDEHGKPSIVWDNWPAQSPRVIHIETNSQFVPWAQLPNLVCIYEPHVGVRVIENPLARRKAGDGSVEARRQAIVEKWKECFGREPRVHRTAPLDETLEAVREHYVRATESGESDEELMTILLDCVDRVQAAYRNEKPTMADMLDFSDSLEAMVNSEHGEFVRQQLFRSHPFSMQASRLEGPEFLVIEDPELNPESALQELSKLHAGNPYAILIDFSRLRYKSWQELPRFLMCLEQGTPRLKWNCFHELTQRQVQTMTKRPFMAHQYARRIADLWQEETGRRPEVRVMAIAQLNKRKPQLIIDPSADLASVPLRFIGHNDWIYQADSSAAQLDAPQVASRPRGTTPRAAASNSTREIRERYPNGQPKKGIQWSGSNKEDYTVVKWHENGQIALLAEYKNNQPHGKQTKWRPDGTLLLEMHFENGKPHGLATSWDENGKLAEKAQFFEGQQVNFEEQSKASEIPATAERTGSTNVKSSLR